MMHVIGAWPLWKFLVASLLIVMLILFVLFIVYFKEIRRDVNYWLDGRDLKDDNHYHE